MTCPVCGQGDMLSYTSAIIRGAVTEQPYCVRCNARFAGPVTYPYTYSEAMQRLLEARDEPNDDHHGPGSREGEAA